MTASVAKRQAGRAVIINADDFGMCPAVNRGVMAGHREGVITSASLMVHRASAGEAARLARRCPELAVGLHLDLAEWVRRDGRWEARYRRVDAGDEGAVRREIECQVERFRRLLGREPTHLDSHQHIHRAEPVRSIALEAASRMGVPLRGASGVRHEGGFHGQDERGGPYPEGVSVARLLDLLAGLPEGVTEIGCHPAVGAVADAYGAERAEELRTLCDPAVAGALRRESIELLSFMNLYTVDETCVLNSGS